MIKNVSGFFVALLIISFTFFSFVGKESVLAYDLIMQAINYYDENRGASFNTFMSRVVSNRMIRVYNNMRDYSKLFFL